MRGDQVCSRSTIVVCRGIQSVPCAKRDKRGGPFGRCLCRSSHPVQRFLDVLGGGRSGPENRKTQTPPTSHHETRNVSRPPRLERRSVGARSAERLLPSGRFVRKSELIHSGGCGILSGEDMAMTGPAPIGNLASAVCPAPRAQAPAWACACPRSSSFARGLIAHPCHRVFHRSRSRASQTFAFPSWSLGTRAVPSILTPP